MNQKEPVCNCDLCRRKRLESATSPDSIESQAANVPPFTPPPVPAERLIPRL